MLKTLCTSFFITAAISGCQHQGSLVVYDRETCVDLAEDGAHCEHAFVNKARDMTKEQWDKERPKNFQFCTSSASQTDIETLIDQACFELNCTYMEHENLKRAFTRLSKKAANARAKKGEQ